MSTQPALPISLPENPTPHISRQDLERLAARKNTDAAYGTAWASFETYCDDGTAQSRNQRPLPATPQTVVDYLRHLQTKGYAIRTIRQHKAAIRRQHLARHFADPSKDPNVRAAWVALLHDTERKAPRPTLSLLRAGVRKVIDRIDFDLANPAEDPRPCDRIQAVRDRALILLASSSARLSTHEVYSLTYEEMDRDSSPDIEILVQRSPDAIAKPRLATVKRLSNPTYCPVRALNEWIEVAGILDGPIFRSIDQHGHIATRAVTPRNLRVIVEQRAATAGIDAATISMRSLQRGSMLQAAYDGHETNEEIIESAGLSKQTLLSHSETFDSLREMKKQKKPAPAMIENSPSDQQQTHERSR